VDIKTQYETFRRVKTIMEEWTQPENYIGPSLEGDYVVYTIHRDSGAMERSNYECLEGHFNNLISTHGDSDKEFIYIQRCSHWAVGWVKHLMLSGKSPEYLTDEAFEIDQSLADYPVFNESHYSELEWGEVTELWKSLDIKERIYEIKNSKEPISIFSARRDFMPDGDNGGQLFGNLRESVA
jgi:hypothetical protein